MINNTQNHLSGVKCNVQSCKHYSEGDYCCANQISIAPPNAVSSTETGCMTYQSN